jgi:hypothetical protein
MYIFFNNIYLLESDNTYLFLCVLYIQQISQNDTYIDGTLHQDYFTVYCSSSVNNNERCINNNIHMNH